MWKMNVDKQEIIDMIRDKSPRLELVCFDAGKSEAWRWFKRVRVDGCILPYAVCNGCFKPVHYTPRDGTGGLRRHACAHTMALAQAKGHQPHSQKNDSRTSKERDKGVAAVSPQGVVHPGSDIRNPRLSSASSGDSPSRLRNNRRSSVPLSLTLWAAERGLVDLHNSTALSLSSLMAGTPYAQHGINPFADLFNAATSPLPLPQPPVPPSRSSTSSSAPAKPANKIADIALDLAMKKASEEPQSNGDTNAQSAGSGQCRAGRRPRKRSNPDRAIPASLVNGDDDVNLHMLAQVSQESKSKEARLSSSAASDVHSHARIKQEPLSVERSAMNYVLPSHARPSSPEFQSTPPVIHPLLMPSPSEATTGSVSDDETLGDVAKFIADIDEELSVSPECTLRDAAAKLKLDGLKKCLTSLLNLHNNVLLKYKNKMPVPELQKPAPQFKGIAVVDGQFKDISLDDYKGKYVVLFFYPLDFTFVCPTEIIAFSERAEEFRNIGCELIACSTDSHFCHLAWVNTPRKQGGLGSLDIPLLADKSAAISKAYGVYKEDEGLPFRGLFIIDGQQRLRQVTINDLPVGRSVDETLRLVQAFQFTDKHGEVCPAGWTPGKKTMKADPSGSKEYFQSQE